MEKKNDKNKKLFFRIKIFIILSTFILSFVYTVQILDKINLQVDDLFLSTLVSSSNHLKGEGISSNLVNYITSLDLFNPLDLLQTNYKGLISTANNKLDEDSIGQSEPTMSPDDDTSNSDIKPIVYIFNTHQGEEYAVKNASNYSVKPDVLLASYILQDKLQQYGIRSIVEENDVLELLRINNWNYASSYKITKMLMEQAYQDNPSLTYFIDLHRDSVSRDKTTVTIKDKTYAKVFFLLGLENENYKENEKVISRMNEIIESKYPGISRGIYEKSGPGVDGVYNQDFSSRCVLIEVGGVDNTIDEVSNTIDAIAYMLNTYIGENHD